MKLIHSASFSINLFMLLMISTAGAWNSPSSSSSSSRRQILQKGTASIFAGTFMGNLLCNMNDKDCKRLDKILLPPASLAESLPSTKDLSRLQKGHSRVRYLLEHWEDVTQICGKGVMSDVERKQVIRTEGGGGGFCEKNPLMVQEFLGYKSINDPLFKADKLMLKAAPLVDPNELENYLDVVEAYREKADQGSMMAYTSSWGEANPNGGKEVIDEYLDRTKVEVEQTEVLLRSILGYLNLDVLPPSKSSV